MKYVREYLIPVLIALAVFGLIQMVVKTFKVHNVSMLPTIQPGDYIIVNGISYLFAQPQRGDIIVFDSPQHQTDLIKRIIALPGDTVEVKDGQVFVNGSRLNEPYIFEPPLYTMPPKKVATGNYFVLGDDRNRSNDSHTGWTVPRQDIVGKAWLVYWPPSRWQMIKHHNPLNTASQRTVSKFGTVFNFRTATYAPSHT